MERVLKQNGESANSQRVAQAKFTSKSPEGDRTSAIDDSPAMVAQRKKLQGLFGGAVQRQGAEDEMLQGKFETAQRVEEEEPLQGKFEAAQRVEEEEPLQGKFETAQRVEEEEPLQGKFEAASSTQLKEEAAKPNNTGLPDNLKSGIESLSGMSMDSVKVHYNSPQPAQLNALAYAQGTDIHVAPGQEQHLPHEAWHVVQQAQGRVKPTMQMKEGVPVNDDKSLEHEADVMGAKAVTQRDYARGAGYRSQYAYAQQDHTTVQRRSLEDVGGALDDMKLRKTGHTFSVIGQFGDSNAKLYADKSDLVANDKNEAMGLISARAGEIGGKTAKELKKNVEAPHFTKEPENLHKEEVGTIDPFTHGSYCQIGDSQYLVMMYQHTYDLDGYVTGIEEGDVSKEGEYGPKFRGTMKYGKKQIAGMNDIDPGVSYSQLHKQVGDTVLSEVSGKGDAQADAMTKLAGEGARFEWVRRNIRTITDNTEYVTKGFESLGGKSLGILFKNLWCQWKDWFKGKYNIKDDDIDNELYAHRTNKLVIKK